MKTKYFLVLSALAVLLAIIGPVSAFSQDIGIKTQGPAASFSMILTPDANGITVPVQLGGNNEYLSQCNISVVSNVPFAVTVNDNLNVGTSPKPAQFAGHLGSMDPLVGTWLGTYLTEPINIGIIGEPYVALSATPTAIHSQAIGGSSWAGLMKFKQGIQVLDPVLPSNLDYQSTITVSGGSL